METQSSRGAAVQVRSLLAGTVMVFRFATGSLQPVTALALSALCCASSACGGGAERTAGGSPLDARRVAPAERAAVDALAPGVDALAPVVDALAPVVDAAYAGDGAAGLAPSGSPGTVVLRLVLPAGRSYCDQGTLCDSQSHIFIQDLSGRPVTVALPYCPISCNSFCAPPPCVGIPCVPMGIPFTGEQRTWDGLVHAASTCGMSTTCYQGRYLPRGRYLAVMCATPGQLTGGDGGGNPSCQATGARQCVEVPFDFPSDTPVVGQLP